MALSARTVVVAATASLMAVYLTIPRTFPIAPSWKITIRTEEGAPVPGVLCREAWRHAGVGARGTADVRADEEGNVLFPPRSVSMPPFWFALRFLGTALKFGIYFESESHAQVTIGVRGAVRGCTDLVYSSAVDGARAMTSRCIVSSDFEPSAP